ncbi:MAG: hypothetical protein D6722_15240 [Bacteroidetes bacterium]|nr:MAG: hypothetical protein D6722_15240 [Bacteroidota bacterium]
MKNTLLLGCGRSGTSIFGELFATMPDYTYRSEPDFEALAGLNPPFAVKVPRESAAYPPDAGLSFPVWALEEMLPAPRQLFWIVRHPLDAIASLRVGISRNWGHHPRPAGWRDWLERPLIERCAYHWQYLNTVGYGQVAHLVEVVHFEDMIRDPQAFAEKICRQVGGDPAAMAPALAGWAARVQDRNTPAFVEAETSRPYSTRDHKVRVGRWRENLSAEEVRQALPLIRDAARAFGYALPPDGSGEY